MAGEKAPTPASAPAPAPTGWRLGHTSEGYESGGRGPGTVSSGYGDAGGQSYGNWQLSSNAGTLGEYLQQSGYKEQFKGLELGSPDFNAKWREVAKTDPTGFQQDQYNFIKASHFDKQVERLKADGLDLSGRGPAVQDALWSSAVQYRGLTKGIFEKGLEEKFGTGYDLAKFSDKDIVTAVQDFKISHNETLMGRNSAAVKASVRQRAENEKSDLLSLADGKLVHHGAHAHKPASIGEIQTKLGQLGYTNPDKTPLAADGHMGRNTREALKAFQHEHHLKETGTADPATLKAIDATLEELGVQRQATPTTEQSNDPKRWGPSQITDPAHPGNMLFKQAQAGMQAIDAKFGRTSDHQTDNAAGHVAVKAQCAGMKCIDHLELGGTSGEKIIAVQGKLGSGLSKVVSVDTVEALNMPLAQSSHASTGVHAQQQSHQASQVNQPVQAQEAPAMAR